MPEDKGIHCACVVRRCRAPKAVYANSECLAVCFVLHYNIYWSPTASEDVRFYTAIHAALRETLSLQMEIPFFFPSSILYLDRNHNAGAP